MLGARKALACAAALAAIVPLAATATSYAAAEAKVNYWRGVNPVTELTSDTFATPPANDRPWVRWNWPPAAVTIPQLEDELDQLAAAGVRGVEIGQGGNPTNEQLTAILKKANALGITVGLKYSGGAPATGSWVNTNDYTRTTLNNSRTFVNAGAAFNGRPAGHRHDHRGAGLPVHRDTVPGHRRARDRPLVGDQPDVADHGHQHRRLLRRHDRGQPELDRPRVARRRAVGGRDLPRRRAAERARAAQQGGDGLR